MRTERFTVGILGATGLTGFELLGLLLRHPGLEVAWLGSESQAGGDYCQAYPHFLGRLSPAARRLRGLAEVQEEAARGRAPDAVFSCLPHGASAAAVKPFLDQGACRVIDLSADFRMRDPEAYRAAYGHAHPFPELLPDCPYGLSEINGPAIARARLVGNPGCYPTSVLLPLIPLLQAGLIRPDGIIADSKSGMSGAGKKPTEGTTFIHVNENFDAYQVGDRHRHLPEMREQLAAAAGGPVDLLFTPHHVPMERGILSTIYCDLSGGAAGADAEACLRARYPEGGFVRVVDDFPATAHVARSNRCHIKAYQPAGGRKLILVSVIDNMVKGASGQALQNLNLALGLDPRLGLE